MSTPGWYPDPAGVPNRLRYFDGSAWTEEVTDRPEPAEASSPTRQGGQRGWWLAGGAAAIVVVAMIVVNLPRPVLVNPVETSSPTISAWNETEQPSPSPSATPSESGSAQPRGTCDDEPIDLRPEPQIVGGRMVLGVMSMPVVKGWDGPVSSDITFALAGKGYETRIEGTWYNQALIGPTNFGRRLDVQTQARLIVECLASSGGMSLYEKPDSLTYTKVSISGHAGIQADAWYSWNVTRLKTKGSLVRVIVVDTPEGPYFFFGEASKERTDVVALIKRLSADLKVR